MEITRYQDADIDSRILRAVEEMGFDQMTPIQEQAIPVLLERKDVIGQAQDVYKRQVYYDDEYRMLLKENGGYRELPMKENTAWLQVLRVIPAGGSAEETIDFSIMYEGTVPGEYLIQKVFTIEHENGENEDYIPVSYTHLDVYKRQPHRMKQANWLPPSII